MKVVVTRPEEKGIYFAKLLDREGFEPILIPTLDLVFKDVEVDLDKYDWIVFTSPRGAEGLFRILKEDDLKKIMDKKIGAIGVETAKEFKKIFNKDVDVVPEKYTAENLLEALQKVVKEDEKILIPTTPSTRDVLKKNLPNVDLVFVYSSEEPKDIKEKLEKLKEIVREEKENGKKIVLTFTSGLTAKNFFKNSDEELLNLLKDQYVVSIGPITKKNVDKYGFDSLIPSDEYTINGMLNVIKKLSE